MAPRTRTAAAAVALLALSAAPASADPTQPVGKHHHGITLEKVERFVGLDAAQTVTQELSCGAGVLADGQVLVQHVDQGTGDVSSVRVLTAGPKSSNRFEVLLRNDATGRAQVKLFALCLPAKLTETQSHTHSFRTPYAKHADVVVPVNGRASKTLSCAANEIAVAPGHTVAAGAARVLQSTATSSTGRARAFTFLGGGDGATVEAEIRCLPLATTAVRHHTHDLRTTLLTRTTSVAPGSTTTQLTCADDAKGIVAGFDLTAAPDLLLQGSEPQPKTRVFSFTNPTAAALPAKLSLLCARDFVSNPTKVA